MSQARVFRQASRMRHATNGMRQYSQWQPDRRPSIAIRNARSHISSPSRSPHVQLFSRNAVNGMRLQSTQADPKSALFEQLPSSAQSTSSNSTDLFEKLSQTSSSLTPDITPHIGMLKEAGLEFGWGPTSMAQWIIEHLHVSAGLPWWGALVGASLLYRVCCLWPVIRSSHYAAIAAAIAPAQREIRERYKSSDMPQQQVMTQQQQEMKYLAKTTGYSITGHLGPVLVQGVLSFGIFRLSRNMATASGIGLEDGGVGWLTDLTVCDPFYILPAITGLTLYITAKNNLSRSKASGASLMAENHIMTQVMVYGLPAITFAVLAWQPGAVQMSMSALSITTAATQTALFAPPLRKALGLALYPTKGSNVVNVRGKRKTDASNKQETSPAEQMMQQFGWGGVGAQDSKVEKARGKAQVRKAQEYDARRRQKLAEQSMRDHV